MKVCLSGFGHYADTLHVETLERFRWQDISGILNIPGVSYYYVEAGTVGVRYNKLVDVRDVAAQTLRVLTSARGISPQELTITADDMFQGDITSIVFADDVWQRACAADTPEHVSSDRIELRGSGPAYWLLP